MFLSNLKLLLAKITVVESIYDVAKYNLQDVPTVYMRIVLYLFVV